MQAPIEAVCENCAGKWTVSASLAGKHSSCPKCGKPAKIPGVPRKELTTIVEAPMGFSPRAGEGSDSSASTTLPRRNDAVAPNHARIVMTLGAIAGMVFFIYGALVNDNGLMMSSIILLFVVGIFQAVNRTLENIASTNREILDRLHEES